MANELKVTIGITLDNGTLKKDVRGDTVRITQTTADVWEDVVSVTTSEADVSPGVTTSGFVWVKNLDATNFIKYGPKSGGSMIEFGRLKAGESTTFRLGSSVTMRWVADTATCKAQIVVFSD